MERVIYRSSAGSIEIGYDGAYLLEGYDGLTAADIEPIVSHGYGQNGYTLGGIFYGERHINLNILLTASNAGSLYNRRCELARVFNPLAGVGVLTYENDYLARSISCIPTVAPTPTDRIGLIMPINVELTAHNPFWYDAQERMVLLRGSMAGLRFPLKFMPKVKFGIVGNDSYVNNTGDVPAPIRAVYTSTINNPRLILDETGEYIQINAQLSGSAALTVTTGYGQKNVVLTKADGTSESAFHMIDIGSTFFSLPQGQSHIKFESTGNIPVVKLYWRNYYVGV